MDIANKYGMCYCNLLWRRFIITYIFLKIAQILDNFYITRFVLRLLLEIGSDPCNKNKKLQTPYAAANDKKTRNTFRRFMEANPDKFNYQKVLFITEYIASISKET